MADDNKKCVIVFHGADFDGRMSAAILYRKALEEGLRPVFWPYNHGGAFRPDMMVGTGHVWIADISFPPETMKSLAESGLDVRWWDHHASSFRDSIENGYDKLKGTRTMGGTKEASAVMLVCRDCYPDNEKLLYVAGLVSAADTKDTRHEEWDEMVVPFQNGLYVYFGDDVEMLTKSLQDIEEDPMFIRNIGEKTAEQTLGFRNGKAKRSYVVELNGEDCAVAVCAKGKPSVMGQAARGCRYAMVLHREQGGKFSVSMRANVDGLPPQEAEKYDCPALLRDVFGGERSGGHKFSAGAHSLELAEIKDFLFCGPRSVRRPLNLEEANVPDTRNRYFPVLKGIDIQRNPLVWNHLTNELRQEFHAGVFPVTVNGERWNCLMSGILDGDVFTRLVGREDYEDNNIRISPVPGSDRWEVCWYHVTADDHVEVVTDSLEVGPEFIVKGLETCDFTEAVKEAQRLKWSRSTGAGKIVEAMGEGWSLDVDIADNTAVINFPLPGGGKGMVDVGYREYSSQVLRKLSDAGVSSEALLKVYSDADLAANLDIWASRVLFNDVQRNLGSATQDVVNAIVPCLTREAALNIIVRKDKKMHGNCKAVAIKALRWAAQGYEGPCPLHEGGVLERLPALPPVSIDKSMDGPGGGGGAGGGAVLSGTSVKPKQEKPEIKAEPTSKTASPSRDTGKPFSDESRGMLENSRTKDTYERLKQAAEMTRGKGMF